MNETKKMNGAHSLVRSLIGGGVDTCFANPGTSEMHFVAALDEVSGIRCVLGLQENVVTGMADGYWRMARKPACTLLHCGPGLANGFANLHNARRARSGILNIVGDQATYHRPFDAPLTADTEGIARAASNWVRTSMTSVSVAQDAMVGLQAAKNGQVATLVLPSDVSWDSGGSISPPLPNLAATSVDPLSVENSARILRSNGSKVLLLLGGDAVLSKQQELAWSVAKATGASLMVEYGIGRIERGLGRLPLERVPYGVDAAINALARYEHIVLIGAKPPVSFFAYPGKPSTQYAPQTQLHTLVRPEQCNIEGLEALSSALGVQKIDLPRVGSIPERGQGVPTPEGLARTLGAFMPEHAIVCDESISYGRGFYAQTYNASPHDWLHLTGGAIGIGIPLSTGAALGAPGRRVINLQGDGSAMYTLQALWTQARQQLPCTTIILKNRSYNILIGEYRAVGAEPGSTAMDMLDLGKPDLDWVRLAGGMGVEGAQATTLEQCADLLVASFKHSAPFVIELLI